MSLLMTLLSDRDDPDLGSNFLVQDEIWWVLLAFLLTVRDVQRAIRTSLSTDTAMLVCLKILLLAEFDVDEQAAISQSDS